MAFPVTTVVLSSIFIVGLLVTTCLAVKYYNPRDSYGDQFVRGIRKIIPRIRAMRRRFRARRSSTSHVEPSVAPLYDPSAPPTYMASTNNTGASNDASSVLPSAPPIDEENNDMTSTNSIGASNYTSSSRFGTTNQAGQSINVSGASAIDEKGRLQNTYRPPSPRRHNRDDTDEAPPPSYDSLFD